MFKTVKADYTWEDVGNDANGKVYTKSQKEAMAAQWNTNAKALNDNIANEKLKLIIENLVEINEKFSLKIAKLRWELKNNIDKI